MELKELHNKNVAIWGMGVEGQAARRYLQEKLPQLPLTIIDNNEGVTADLRDDSAETLSKFDIIIKTPGISIYTDNVVQTQKNGTRFISATNLWFANERKGKLFGVTGTKGKSTTTSLLAHILKQLGFNATAAGNIGVPLITHKPTDDSITILEMSSFQSTGFEGVLDGMIITSLFPEHMDWHNGEAQYFHDKMTPIRNMQGAPLFIPLNNERVETHTKFYKNRIYFNRPDSFHARGNCLYAQETKLLDMAETALIGAHNIGNICGILELCKTLGIEAADTIPHIKTYQPLPHRLQTVAHGANIRCVDDSIATSPYAALAAINSFPPDEKLAIIMGGYDRGISWDEFSTLLKPQPNMHFFVMGLNREKITNALLPHAKTVAITQTESMVDATEKGFSYLQKQGGGTLLLSPGSPSYDQFNNYAERGDKFKEVTNNILNVHKQGNAA